MAFRRFSLGAGMRATMLFATLAAFSWMLMDTAWYVSITLAGMAAIAELWILIRYATTSDRQLARFLDAVEFEDTSQQFVGRVGAVPDLGAAMSRVMERLRRTRTEREEQARYAEAVLSHVPVALISIDAQGRVQLLNPPARLLLGRIREADELSLFGDGFAAGVASLKPGSSALLRMERGPSVVPLKASASALVIGGRRRRLISFQNIESELSAQELDAWQSVIRVMAHEVMNSLTPISSLSETAHKLVREVADSLPREDIAGSKLADAAEALETVARRSDGLLHFVQTHRRITKHLVARTSVVPVRRIFARLERLFAVDLDARGIALATRIDPETLELTADAELIEQALINLIRNAIEALRDHKVLRISLSAAQGPNGSVALSVTDTGPGIDAAQRERIFVPFYTTKRHGTGVGLTLVRQIAALHGGSVEVLEAPGGGATFVLTLR